MVTRKIFTEKAERIMGEQIFHVCRRARGWVVMKEGFHRPHITNHTREEALVLARRLARGAGHARVVVDPPPLSRRTPREWNAAAA